MDALIKPADLPRLSTEQVQRRLAACPRLPSLGSLSKVLSKLLDAEQCYTSQIADVIRRDPSMTTRLLRLVNSVYYSLSRPVGRIEDAVFYLGIRQIRRLSAVTPVIESLQNLAGRERFPWTEFWRHCIATAFMTRELLGDVNAGLDEIDYVAGLLHDVGKIIMAAAFPDYFDRIQIRLSEEGGDQLRIESETLGFDHCELGAFYLKAHKLPESTIQAVRYHHQPKRAAGDPRIVAAVQISDLFVRHAHIGNSGNPAPASKEDCANAEGWDILFPRVTAERAIAFANLEQSLERSSIGFDGLL